MKLTKRITSLLTCLVLTVCLATSVSAVDYTPKTGTFMTAIGGATVTMTLSPTPDACTATTSINKRDVSTAVTVYVDGTYTVEGIPFHAQNNGSGDTGATAYISCGLNGTWQSITSTHYGKYNGIGNSDSLSA